jgi:hypothetical protein
MLAVLHACSNTPAATAPTVPVLTSLSAYRGAAFILDVSTTRRVVKVSPPVSAAAASTSQNPLGARSLASGPNASLLGADVIEMQISNYVAGAVGATAPGKVLVTFDLTLVNRLRSVALGTPTFPHPPVGVTGVQAFPFEVSVVTSPGGVSSQSNQVVVTSPSFGQAIASAEWDGPPHSFFNDANCGPTSTDCFRYEPFGTIAANGTSLPRRVGFLIDPTVRDLRIKLLVAADIFPTGTATITSQ